MAAAPVASWWQHNPRLATTPVAHGSSAGRPKLQSPEPLGAAALPICSSERPWRTDRRRLAFVAKSDSRGERMRARFVR
jgi:hypothetical protein